MQRAKLIRVLVACALGAASVMLSTHSAAADDPPVQVCAGLTYSTDGGNTWQTAPDLLDCGGPCLGYQTGVITVGSVKVDGYACVKGI